MGTAYPSISQTMADWIRHQKVFFVATAPLSPNGMLNCSPKGGDTFRIIDDHTVAYQDLTGSGAETIAHLRENGRIVIMFCAFDGGPMIVRLHGRGEVVLPGMAHFDALNKRFPQNSGTRSIILVHVSRVSDSCGMAVPLMAYQADRHDLDEWADNKGPEKLAEYRARKNRSSIDGLPALE